MASASAKLVLVILGFYWVYIGFILGYIGLYWGYIGDICGLYRVRNEIVQGTMETKIGI